MARPKKQGIDYFPFDINLFQDIKIRKLIKYQSGKAITVYALLLCFIYKDGYYIRWDKELPFIISEQTGFEEAYISEVINSCLKLGLFNSDLYESDKILTSKGIQERYRKINDLCRRNGDICEFSLISSEEIGVSSEETAITSEKSTQRKVNKRKVNNTFPSPPLKGGGRKREGEPKEINSKARLLFEGHFKETFSDSYYWTPKDAGAMSQLLQKITFSRKEKGMPTDDESVISALGTLLSSIKEGWIFENFSVTNINSKYNEIVAQAKRRISPKPSADIGVLLQNNSPDKYDSPQEKRWEERWNR
ncbi:DUF4373 domain-containing protein [Bacteroides heparinolyticus]|uniref:DUF4373 domain-containing protein n=1 Tax=Prevotella heparinolytica TaxID=28113 RepID=UPI003AEF73DE